MRKSHFLTGVYNPRLAEHLARDLQTWRDAARPVQVMHRPFCIHDHCAPAKPLIAVPRLRQQEVQVALDEVHMSVSILFAHVNPMENF